MSKNIHVHFMGIGGSGMAPVAIISKHLGYKVSGCDMSTDGYYIGALIENKIEIQSGHSAEHLEDVDILAVSPAIFDLNPNHPEIVEARKRNILMTWQEFAGKYLHDNKTVIAISGTHGKSTTTVLMGATLEHGGFDPYVEAGTVYKPWGGGYKIGSSEYFVCEADEFNNNFLNFSPSIAIINNIEMDHPEFFRDFTQVKEAFKNFVQKLKAPKILVVNEESQGVREMLQELEEYITSNSIKTIGYYLKDRFDFPFSYEYKGSILSATAENTSFEVECSEWNDCFEIGVTGVHNVANSLGVLAASFALGMEKESLKKAFREFKGIARRSEFIGEVKGVKFFDDFAHHPTAISMMLDSFRMSYPDRKIWTVMEPHQISRLKLFMNEFAAALDKSDKVIITKIFVGREKFKNLESLDMNLLVNQIGTHKAKYIEDFDSVADFIFEKTESGDIVVVFGAGESYKLTRKIVKRMNEEKLAEL
ncbi:MAG: UDP-N-acetylmuramate--L-alanine ligase [Clostridia bacterium]|nr:UDP-N-acetylmuramate--L-alanine ligase [Clostridia bacterium]